MTNDRLLTNAIDDEYVALCDITGEEIGKDCFFLRDISDVEAEAFEFYLILSGKYAKRMRQLFASFEKDLLELN